MKNAWTQTRKPSTDTLRSLVGKHVTFRAEAWNKREESGIVTKATKNILDIATDSGKKRFSITSDDFELHTIREAPELDIDSFVISYREILSDGTTISDFVESFSTKAANADEAVSSFMSWASKNSEHETEILSLQCLDKKAP